MLPDVMIGSFRSSNLSQLITTAVYKAWGGARATPARRASTSSFWDCPSNLSPVHCASPPLGSCSVTLTDITKSQDHPCGTWLMKASTLFESSVHVSLVSATWLLCLSRSSFACVADAFSCQLSKHACKYHMQVSCNTAQVCCTALAPLLCWPLY